MQACAEKINAERAAAEQAAEEQDLALRREKYKHIDAHTVNIRSHSLVVCLQ